MNETPKSSIPFNEEHFEAYQDEVNRKREEMLATRPPEEVARMRVIESVAGQLEAANIPFVMWANPVLEPDKVGFIRFNKLEYMAGETLDKRVGWLQRQAYYALFPDIMWWISRLFGIRTAAFYDKNSEFMFGHDLSGERAMIIEKKESS